MSIKLKALGLGLLALLATSLFVVNASATKAGHFVSDVDHVIIKGTESNPGNHNMKFQRTNPEGNPVGLPIECTHVHYHATVPLGVTTTDEIQVTPRYTNCATQGGVWGEVSVHHEAGCGTNVLKFTSAEAGKKATVDVECQITITHPNCTIRIPKQTLSGVTYDTVEEANKHAITVTSTVRGITGNFEGGACIFLGTSQKFDMDGSATVWGEDTDGNRVNITAT